MVVGASGAGKSSVLRAGVVAALGPAAHPRRAPATTPRRCSRRGEPTPLAALAARPPAVRRPAPARRRPVRGGVRPGRRRGGARGVHPGAVRARRAGGDRPARRLLRSRARVRPSSPAPRRRAQVVVGPMSDAELRAADRRTRAQGRRDGGGRPGRGPARRPAPDRRRVRHRPRLLPLLSHALLATWRRGQGVRMTVADYHAVGRHRGRRGAVRGGGVHAAAGRPAGARPADLPAARARRPGHGRHPAPGGARGAARAVPRSPRSSTSSSPAGCSPSTAHRRDHPRGAADRLATAARAGSTPTAPGWPPTAGSARPPGRGATPAGIRTCSCAAAGSPLRRRLTAERAGELNDVERAFLAAATARDRPPSATPSDGAPAGSGGCWPCWPSRCWSPPDRAPTRVKQRGDMARERDVAVSRQVAVRSDMLRGEGPVAGRAAGGGGLPDRPDRRGPRAACSTPPAHRRPPACPGRRAPPSPSRSNAGARAGGHQPRGTARRPRCGPGRTPAPGNGSPTPRPWPTARCSPWR